MKRLTLDQTWKLCLSMWRWIAKQKKGGSKKRVETLKRLWLTSNGFKKKYVQHDCFFCEYDSQHHGSCFSCPATKIEEIEFIHCTTRKYNWKLRPIDFYDILHSLNRKRLAKRKKQ